MSQIIQSVTCVKSSFPSATWEGDLNIQVSFSFQSCTLEEVFQQSLTLNYLSHILRDLF